MNAAVARLENDASAELSDMLRKSVQDFAALHPGVARTRRHRDLEPGYDPTMTTSSPDLSELHGVIAP